MTQLRQPLPEGFETFCPERANRKQFTAAEIAEMQRIEDLERERRKMRERRNPFGRR